MLLARRFNVAHMTMRQAINSLVEERVLIRLPANGTYVIDRSFSSQVTILPPTRSSQPNSSFGIRLLPSRNSRDPVLLRAGV
jgi:DNA-binding GntR family transcriptional regulator